MPGVISLSEHFRGQPAFLLALTSTTVVDPFSSHIFFKLYGVNCKQQDVIEASLNTVVPDALCVVVHCEYSGCVNGCDVISYAGISIRHCEGLYLGLVYICIYIYIYI